MKAPRKLPESFQKLPEAPRSSQRLPGGSENTSSSQKAPRKLAESSQKAPRRLPEAPRSSQKLPEAPRKVRERFQKFPGKLPNIKYVFKNRTFSRLKKEVISILKNARFKGSGAKSRPWGHFQAPNSKFRTSKFRFQGLNSRLCSFMKTSILNFKLQNLNFKA